MQTQAVWHCSAGGPLSFDAMRSAVGIFLLAKSQGIPWLVQTGAKDDPADVARLRRELYWLGIPPDGIMPVTRQAHDCCCAAAAHLLTSARAYCSEYLQRRQVFFRLSEKAVLRNVMHVSGRRKMTLQSGMAVEISRRGIVWRSADGVTRRCTFAAMPDLVLKRQDGRELFNSKERTRQLVYGKRFRIAGAAHAEFTGREILFTDTDGHLRRYLMEQLTDPVIITETGHPASVLVRVLMAIDHGAGIQAGDMLDEREAALQVLLFDTFGYPPPRFQLISPGDTADAPDFAACRRMGIVPQVLFQELARMVCGSAPVEKMRSLSEWVRLYHSRAEGVGFRKFDRARLIRMNRLYLAQLPAEEFARLAVPYAAREVVREARYPELAARMQSSVSLLSEAANWR
ncbi:MAG: hypothetical protein J6S73_06910 [Lentisphaeria bacterium]|nr:hypothetical protein [Lentisphaeria bacterium]